MPSALKHLIGPAENIVSVLAKWSDGKYYAVQRLESKPETKKILVRFEDGVECWLPTTDLHLQLAIDDIPEEDLVCCVCDGGTSAAPNEIIICDGCQQGYHVNCHEPNIDRENVKLEDDLHEWFCNTCVYLIKSQPKPSIKVEKSAVGLKTPRKHTPAKKTPKKRPATPIVRAGDARLHNETFQIERAEEILVPEAETPVASSVQPVASSVQPVSSSVQPVSSSIQPVASNAQETEDMDTILINTAQKLAESQIDIVDTNHFVRAIKECSKTNLPRKIKPKHTAKRSDVQKSAAPTAAAF